MRLVEIGKLRAKILTEVRQGLADTFSIEVQQISDNCVVLSSPVKQETVQAIQKLILSFKIAGKWNSYSLCNLKVHSDDENKGVFDRLSFEINQSDISQFKRDFSLARR